MFSQFSHTFFFPAIENVNEVMYHHLVGYKAGSSDLIRLQVHWATPRIEQQKSFPTMQLQQRGFRRYLWDVAINFSSK